MRPLTAAGALVLVLAMCGLLVAASPLAGTWQLVSESSAGENNSTLTVNEEGGSLSGTLRVGGVDCKLVAPKLQGDMFSFTVTVGDYTSNVEMKLSGNKLEGTWKSGGNQGPIRGTKQ